MSIRKITTLKYILLLLLSITLIVIGSFILIYMQDSIVYDNNGDAYALALFTGKVIPEVMGFHDISSFTVKRNYETITLSIKVNGDLNSINNYRYETVYIWEMEYVDILLSNKHYIIVLPYFPEGHLMGYKGWYIAVFDANSNRWIVPMISIDDHPINSSSSNKNDTISINIPTSIIGNPLVFSCRVSVMVNVDTQVHPMPDYIMDTAPDNSSSGIKPVLIPFVT